MQVMQSSDNELNSQISQQQFVQQLQQVSKDGLFTYPVEIFSMAYQKIIQENNGVTKNDVQQLSEQLKMANQAKFNEEINYYRQFIRDQTRNAKESVLPSELHQAINQYPTESLLGDILLEQTKKCEFVSLRKLEKVITEIQLKYDLGSKALKKERYSLAKSVIASSEDSKNIVGSLFTMAAQYISDPYALEEIEKLCEKHEKLEEERRCTQAFFENDSEEHKKQISLLEDKLDEVYNQLLSSEDNVTQLKERKQLLTDRNAKLEKQIIDCEIRCNNLEEAYYLLEQDYNEVSSKLDQKKGEIKQFVTDYKELNEEYDQFLEQIKQEKMRQTENETQKVFVSRSLKEQLADSNAKNSKLIQEKKQLINKLSEQQLTYSARINQLEKELEDAESKGRDSSINRLNFNEDFRLSRMSQARMSQSRMSQAQSKQIQIKSIVDSIYHEAKQGQSLAFKKKSKQFKEIELSVAKAFNPEERRECEVPVTQESGDYMGIMANINSEFKKSFLEEEQQEPSENQEIEEPKFFSCKALIVKNDGNRYEVILLVTSNRLIILDTKFRKPKDVHFKYISKISVCEENQNWFVVHLKHKMKEQMSNYPLGKYCDIVFSVTQRKQLLKFLAKYSLSRMLKDNTKVVFDEDSNIWVKEADRQQVLLKYKGVMNPMRISISCSKFCFHVTVCQDSVLSFEKQAILLIQPIGMLFFEKDGLNELDKKQDLLFLLPIVKDMECKESKDKRDTLKISYKHWKLAFLIGVEAMAEMERLKGTILEQQETTVEGKKRRAREYQDLFGRRMQKK